MDAKCSRRRHRRALPISKRGCASGTMTDAAAPATVAIVGGGPVGMALALALHQSGVRAAVFDARARGAAAGDPRVLALAHGSRLTLEALGLWRGLAATPIETIHISQRGGFGRTRLRAADYGIPALGYVIGVGDLSSRLARALDANGIEYRGLCRALSAETTADGVALRFQGGDTATARLVAWAEGASADPGAPDVLEAYRRGRRLDRRAAIGFTDGLVRLFGSGLPPLRTARGLGLLALDLMPPLRDFVAKRMMFGARA